MGMHVGQLPNACVNTSACTHAHVRECFGPRSAESRLCHSFVPRERERETSVTSASAGNIRRRRLGELPEKPTASGSLEHKSPSFSPPTAGTSSTKPARGLRVSARAHTTTAERWRWTSDAKLRQRPKHLTTTDTQAVQHCERASSNQRPCEPRYQAPVYLRRIPLSPTSPTLLHTTHFEFCNTPRSRDTRARCRPAHLAAHRKKTPLGHPPPPLCTLS